MKYRGRELDPYRLWGEYVQFPPNIEENGEFAPLVYCPNPDHSNERSPAFQINVELPLVHCFTGCGISGNYAHAISIIEGITYAEADRRIRRCLRRDDAVGSEGVSRRSSEITREYKRPASFSPRGVYKRYLSPPAISYLDSRGIYAESIAKWELGFDVEEQRIVIPVHDSRGRLAFLIKRGIMENQHPKYLYDAGSNRSAVLFGLDKCDQGMIHSSGMVLVEGSLDAIRLHQHGLTNAVAILGSSVSSQQAKLISRSRPKRVFFMFDRDAAGVEAILKSVPKLRKVPLAVCRYPAHRYDPAELSKEEAYRAITKALGYLNFKRYAAQIQL
jgi:DNA primase